MKYGIKIPFIFDSEYMWLTQGDSKFQLAPLLFDSKAEAEEYALKVCGPTAIVEEYGQDKDTH